MSDRLRYLCDKDLRTHTDADLDDYIYELQKLTMRKLQDLRMRDNRIEELKADVSTAGKLLDKRDDQLAEICTRHTELQRKYEALARIVYEYVDPFQIENPEDVAIVEAVVEDADEPL